ncbi:EAL domain-containing protein [Pseudanabaena sp. PCC 6802]|uniref:sensor domain-containing protein n=1 Tax=Pseudanabaena sp. PCC 6802 TaxID=118173 RepID=UPI000348DCE8|nr:EAL domain-containing protein [Pseudanabaena sp. PCC 6802]
MLSNSHSKLTDSLATNICERETFAKAFWFSSAIVAISTLPDGELVEVNDSFCRDLGYTREEILRQNSLALRLWVDPDEHDYIFSMVCAEGGIFNHQVKFYTRSGLIRNVELSAELITCSGQPHILFVGSDITERKQAEIRNSYAHTPQGSPQISEQLILENRLYYALEQKELTVYYQPKVNINTGEVIGTEALLRWASPELGWIVPNRFIPIAEQTGLIIPIGEWVLRTACLQNRAWIEAGLSKFRVAVNLSLRQVQQPDFISSVEKVLKETRLSPRFLELEITETAMMQDIDHTRWVLGQLREMGITITIDDFGMGYTSLSYLKELPCQSLKVDRYFVKDLAVNPYDRAIATALLSLGRSLNLSVVAEGIETLEQMQCLQSLGCIEGQGFFFSTPRSASEVTELLKKAQAQPPARETT